MDIKTTFFPVKSTDPDGYLIFYNGYYNYKERTSYGKWQLRAKVVPEILKLEQAAYQIYLIQTFNADLCWKGECYFKKLEDARRAIEWIESVYMINSMVEGGGVIDLNLYS